VRQDDERLADSRGRAGRKGRRKSRRKAPRGAII
jgi:hypothetical protein